MSVFQYIPNRVLNSNGIADASSIYFYQSGSTVKITIYSDAGYTTPITNPVVVPAGAEIPNIYWQYIGDVRVRIVSADGTVPYDADPHPKTFPINFLPITTDGTLATNSDAFVPTEKAVKTYVDSVRARIVTLEDKGGGVTKTAAQNRQALLDATSGGNVVVRFGTRGGVYDFNPLTITADNVYLDGDLSIPTMRFPSLTSGDGLTFSGNKIGARWIIFAGPSESNETTYVASQILVRHQGTSTSSRLVGSTWDNCFWQNSGSMGLYVQFVDNIRLVNPRAEKIAYCALWFMSCNNGRINGGEVNILNAVGTSANAYGIALTHDSTYYNLDPNAGTPLAANPFCNDWVVDGLRVIGPKIWQGIDTHGCYNTTVANCRVYGASRGISLTTGSGDAAQYAGWSNGAFFNVIDANLPDGSAVSGRVAGDGITARGPTTGTPLHTDLRIIGNTIRGHGISNSVSSASINISTGGRRATISANIIQNWAGAGIVIGGDNSQGIAVTGNIFGDNRDPASDTGGAGACVALNNGLLGGDIIISDNIHDPSTGKEARWGIGGSGHGPTTPLVVLGINPGFEKATFGIANLSRNQIHGLGYPGEILVSGASGTITVDVAKGKLCPGVPLVVRFTGHAAGITVTDFQNAVANQVIILINDSANTVTVTRANAVLPGATNAVLDRYDTMMLMRGLGSTTWHALSSVNSNG